MSHRIGKKASKGSGLIAWQDPSKREMKTQQLLAQIIAASNQKQMTLNFKGAFVYTYHVSEKKFPPRSNFSRESIFRKFLQFQIGFFQLYHFFFPF